MGAAMLPLLQAVLGSLITTTPTKRGDDSGANPAKNDVTLIIVTSLTLAYERYPFSLQPHASIAAFFTRSFGHHPVKHRLQ